MPNPIPKLLFVDEETAVLDFFSRSLCSIGYETLTSTCWEEARTLIEVSDNQPEIIFIEPMVESHKADMPKICKDARTIPVVAISASRDPHDIVTAAKAGVHDYILKPLEIHTLSRTISSVLDRDPGSPLLKKSNGDAVSEFVFCSPQMQQINQTLPRIAEANIPVLLLGESGVGKDVIARTIHQKSELCDKPFVKVNCAAMPVELVDSELFGHRKGAFTGAYTHRQGKFEFADTGTLFLDEISEFTPATQAKLLQVLQDGKFTRLGTNHETHVNVRVIAATNRKLEEEIQKGHFREDLYYRLNVVNIEIPPLRERCQDIPLLCQHFLTKFAPLYNSSITHLPPELEQLFLSYHWPGNVRELENVIKRYVVLQDSDSIQIELGSETTLNRLDCLKDVTEAALRNTEGQLDLKQIRKQTVAAVERDVIERTLRSTHWNKWKAAQQLRVNYKTLLARIKEYQIGS